LAGKYPQILSDELVGEAATQLYRDARSLLDETIVNRSISASGVIGFWPANSVNHDDIIVQCDTEKVTLHHLRQQQDKNTVDGLLYSLADFVAPLESGKTDYIGGFVVTAGIGA